MKVRSVLRTMRSFMRTFVLLGGLVGVGMMPAYAEIIDRIEINQVGDEAQIEIQFRTPIQYLRQASLSNGDIRLYFNLLELDGLKLPLATESMRSPPSDIVPRFTVSYPELDSSLTVSFGRVLAYHVSAGKSGRSISIFIPVIKPKKESVSPASKTGTGPAVGAAAALQAGLDAYQRGNYAAALATLTPLANMGDATAQLMLGVMYEKAQGTTRSYRKAAARYRQAAEQGNAEAQYKLGVLYERGKGVPQDKNLAAEWYRKAADQGKIAARAKAAAEVRAATEAPPAPPSPITTAPAIVAPPIVPPEIVAGGNAAAPVAGEAAPPLPPSPPPPEAVVDLSSAAQRSVEDIEQEAQELITSARLALQHGQNEAAIGTLNRLLNLPPNRQSQAAQELVGVAREKTGELAKARAEFQLYLKLYPNATDAKDVAERLARLPVEGEAKPAQAAPKKTFAAEKLTVFGSVSQTYYKGVSHADSFILASDLTTTASSLTRTDQSQLISTVDLSARQRTETTDTRLVLRESYSADYLPGKEDRNRLTAAYVEQSARDRRYLYRLGRQTGSAGGVPGRFDGAWAGYSLNPMWRVNGVIGTDHLFLRSGTKLSMYPAELRKNFAGMSVDLTRLPEQWSGSAYLIQENADNGIVERRAVGMEAHYFEMRRNYMGLLDYDTLFKAVNIAMFQGNWTTPAETSFNLLVDHRKSPSLRLSNALMGQPVQSLAAVLQSGVTMDILYADAKAMSAISNTYMVAVNHPYTPKLRLGGDFRISNMSGTGATSTGQPASPGSGNTYTYSVQATGNNLFFENDLGVAIASYTDAPTYKAESLAFTQVETFRQNWRVDMLLQFYWQNDNFGTHQTQIRPRLKLNYRLNDSVNFECEGGIEDAHTSSATQNDKTRRKYFFAGYRWDFR